MSDILVKIDDIPGESTFADSESKIAAGQIECTSARHVIQLPVVSTGQDRTEGNSEHGAFELTHSIDKASPHLRLGMSKGTNLGEVVISIMQPIGGKNKPGQVITLGDAYVVEVRLDTPLDPETGLPAEEPQETFALEYSSIKWENKKVVDGVEEGTVRGGYSLTVQAAI